MSAGWRRPYCGTGCSFDRKPSSSGTGRTTRYAPRWRAFRGRAERAPHMTFAVIAAIALGAAGLIALAHAPLGATRRTGLALLGASALALVTEPEVALLA